MNSDPFNNTADSLIAPARQAFAVTPDDTHDLQLATRALYVGTGGDISLRATGSATNVTLRNVASGSVLAIRVAAVQQSGTTASDLIGLA